MPVRSLLYILIPLIVSVLPSTAQEATSPSPEDIYLSLHWTTGAKDTLPSWVCQPLLPQTFLGVSDPLLTPEIGKRQAIQRALTFYSLYQGGRISLLNEIFESTEEKRSNGENDYKTVTVIRLNYPLFQPSFTILREYRSRFGETFVLLSAPSPTSTNGLQQGCIEAMQIFTRVRQEYYDLRLSFNQTIPNDSLLWKDSFLLKREDKKRIVIGCINNLSASPNRGRYLYTDTRIDTINHPIPSVPLFHSFWSAYIESFANELTLHPYSSSLIKTVSDHWNDSASTTLSRETTQNNLSIYLKEIYIQNNRLFTKWEIKETTK